MSTHTSANAVVSVKMATTMLAFIADDALRHDASRVLADMNDSDCSAMAEALMVRVPDWLLPTKEVQAALDGWADGTSASSSPALGSWPTRTAAALQLLLKLLEMAKGSASFTISADASTSASPTRNNSATERRRATMEQEVADADAARRTVRSQCPLPVRLLVGIYEVAAEGGVESPSVADDAMGIEPSWLEPCHLPLLAAQASEAATMVALAAGMPLIRLQAALHGPICRLLHAELECAQAQRSTHRTRRWAAALSHCVRSLRRAYLASASDAHKLLPLLVRWSDVLDAPARASMLRAIAHCIDELPVVDVRWQGALVVHQLRRLLVFREGVVLRWLLPALFAAWPHVTSEHALADAGAREAQHLSLLETMTTELLYVAPYPAARRLYLAHLPTLISQFGLRICCQLAPMLKSIVRLLDAEVETASAAIRPQVITASEADGAAAAAAAAATAIAHFQGARDALKLIHCLLSHAWPRAAAHASLVSRHTIAAHLRAAVAVHQVLRAVPGAKSSPLVEESVAVLQLLGAVGARDVCAAAIELVRTKSALRAARPAGGPDVAALLKEAMDSIAVAVAG